MKTLKAIVVWLLWLIISGVVAFAAIWYGTGDSAWFAGEVQGHQVDEYFKQLASDSE